MSKVMEVIQNLSVASKTFWLVFVGVLSLALVSKLTHASSTKTQYSAIFSKRVKGLMNQCQQTHATAGQDTNALMRLIHLNYCAGYLNALRYLLPDKDIQGLTRTDPYEFNSLLQSDQANTTKYLVSMCPSVKPNNMYAVHTGWI